MTFERVTGGDVNLSAENPRALHKWRAIDKPPVSIGSQDYFDYVASYAMAYIKANAPSIGTSLGTLYWNDIQIHENHYALNYDITVAYGPRNKQVGAYQIQVDQAGGTVHVTAGRRIAGYGATAADIVNNGGLIGVDGDEVHGTDIPIAEDKINVQFRHPQGFLIRSYIKAIGKLVGFPANDSFLGYAAGEPVYLGGTFTESNTEATASYSFAISYNQTGLTIGGIPGIDKKGWDVFSPTYKTTTNNGRKVRQLQCMEIVRPAGREWVNYLPVFGWGH